MILAFDPGVCTGWALADDDGRIRSCGLFWWRDLRAPWFRMGWVSPWGYDWTRLVIEKPQVYSARLQKGDQVDVISTALRTGMLLGWLPCLDAMTPTPREWKGQVMKDVHNKRVLATLSAEERALVPKFPRANLHNAIDAIGLAKWAAGRMK